jgi:hypothetical protein
VAKRVIGEKRENGRKEVKKKRVLYFLLRVQNSP